jgi:hypothetical protein
MAIGNNTIVSSMLDGADMGDSGTSITVSGVDTTGSNTYLLVGLAYNNNDFQLPSSVVYDPGGGDEQSLSAIANTQFITPSTGTRDDGLTQWFGGIVASNASKSVKMTLDAAIVTDEGACMVVIPLTGVDQTTPANNGTGVIQDAGDTLNVNVTSASGDKVYGICFMEGASAETLAAGGGETNEVQATSTNDRIVCVSELSSSGTTNIQVDSSLSDKIVMSCVNIKQASAGGGGIEVLRRRREGHAIDMRPWLPPRPSNGSRLWLLDRTIYLPYRKAA